MGSSYYFEGQCRPTRKQTYKGATPSTAETQTSLRGHRHGYLRNLLKCHTKSHLLEVMPAELRKVPKGRRRHSMKLIQELHVGESPLELPRS